MRLFNKKAQGIVFVLLAFLSSVSFAQTSKSPKTTPPNILLIYVDDLGWSDLGCYGNTYHETPRIDAFAAETMKYTNAYAAAPVCSPARAGLFSGQYPARVGLTDWIPGHWRPYEKKTAVINRIQHLPLEIETFGEVLQQNGYKTGYFGKWHLGDEEPFFVDKQGFEEVVMYQGGGAYYGLKEKFYPPQQIEDSVYLTDALTDYALEFLEANKDTSFCLVVSHFAVHLPLEVPEQYLTPFQAKEPSEEINNPWYAGMLKSLDDNVGRLLDQLDTLGLSDNTVVFFYSDNGGLHKPYREEYLKYTRNQPVTSNAPLKGEKGNLYEGGIRVPLMVRWNDKDFMQVENKEVVTGVDLYPTFLELAGIGTKNRLLDGVSILPNKKNEEQLRNRAVFWHYPVYHHGEPSSAIRSGAYKLIYNHLTETSELYDLENDLSERYDLSVQEPAVTKRLYDQLQEHLKSMGADLPKENPNYLESRRKEWGVHPDKNKEN
ncbi:sulfatase [Algivirga pacifica]|uniref:Sulfatase n=1 Tax=Algivirga pacifica TaxID=1162670 RepID=A0ABP9D9S4_9BACT